jgi:hypothetical protein
VLIRGKVLLPQLWFLSASSAQISGESLLVPDPRSSVVNFISCFAFPIDTLGNASDSGNPRESVISRVYPWQGFASAALVFISVITANQW